MVKRMQNILKILTGMKRHLDNTFTDAAKHTHSFKDYRDHIKPISKTLFTNKSHLLYYCVKMKTIFDIHWRAEIFLIE